MFRPFLTTSASLAAWLAAASFASAQTPINGALSGSLGPGVYHCTGNISVAPSTTLTIAAGTVIKFNIDQLFTIDGTLIVNGTAGSKVYFTDINDDTVGGDSNGNGGATTPGANWWRGLVFNTNADASNLANFEVRYGGRNGYAGIELDNTDLTLTGGAVRSCQGSGLDLNTLGGHPTVSSCTFTSNLGAAIVGANLDAVPGFTNCTASSNGGNYLAVSNGTLGVNATIGSTKGIGGVVYIPVSVSVPSGKTLALQQGAVLKMGIDTLVSIDGTLSVTGTGGNKVYFTDINDDSIGGDTNTNGASSGAANWWRGLQFNSTSSASSLTQFEVRYGGRNGYSSVEIFGSNASFSNGIVSSGQLSGIDLNNTAASPTFVNCSVQNCLSSAIRGLKIDSLPGFTNTTASGNGNNLIEVVDGTVVNNLVVGPSNGIGGVVFFNTSIAVPATKSLTLQAGTICKMTQDALVTLDGTLTCNGASGNRVYFTDFNDDLGGDTNNSATAPAANWWRGLVFNSGASASSLTQFEVRYGGRNGYAGVEIVGSSPTLSNGTVRDCQQAGIDLNNSVSFPSISGCAVQNCASSAIRGVKIDSVPGFSNNTATGNTNNLLEIVDGNLVADRTIGPSNGINGVFYSSSINVPAGVTLALQAGSIFKMVIDGLVTVDGTLVTTGATGNAVIFTDFNDDVGGDSNGNGGATLPAANWWRGLVFNATSDASSIDFADVRYAGRNGYSGVEIIDSDLTLTRSIVRNCLTNAIDLNTSTAKPRINRCSLQNNVGRAIAGVRIDAVPFITRNTASGNQYDQMQVTNGTPTGDLFLLDRSGVNDVIVMATNIYVPPGIRLRLAPNVHIKFDIDELITVDGALDIEGSATNPVVFTDLRDDTIGGDSNGDGAGSSPGANWWRGLVVNSGAVTSSIEGLLLRYGGRNGYAGVYCASPLVSFQRCRVDSCQQQGFILANAARADFLTAWNDSAAAGFRLDGGAFDLRHATAQGCAIGIQKNGAWTGTVASSIAWGNTTNYSSIATGQVRYSDGLVGGTGNINTDPLFVNVGTGDLHLQIGSPCVGTGDPLSPIDPDCTPPDMGAYPLLGVAAPSTYCVAKANSAGCLPFMTFSGYASTTSSEPFYARCYNVLNNKNGLFYYGFSGPMSGPFQGGTKCVAPPTLRLPLINSGGNPGPSDCSGVYQFDFNAHIQGGTDPMLVTGATVNVQCWYRDPQVPSATGLSDGLQFDICN